MTATLAVAGCLVITAIGADLRRRSLPNWLTVAGASAGFACAVGWGWHGLGWAAAGAGLGFLILLPFHCCGAMGGGDVKLMAASGALLGPSGILLAAVLASIFGGIAAAGALLQVIE